MHVETVPANSLAAQSLMLAPQMEAADVAHQEPPKEKEHVEEAKPAKEKKEKKDKEKKEKVGEMNDANKLRAKLEKIDAKIDKLKATKQEIVARLLEIEGTTANAAAPAGDVKELREKFQV